MLDAYIARIMADTVNYGGDKKLIIDLLMDHDEMNRQSYKDDRRSVVELYLRQTQRVYKGRGVYSR